MNLKIEKLSKKFGSNEVLNNVNFSFSSGKIYGLIGRNGSGKTTFFNCLNGSVSRDSGKVTLIGDEGDKKKLTQGDIGFIESEPILPEFLTGLEFIKILYDVQNKGKTSSLDHLFDKVELNKSEQNRLIKAYSHGMKNKIQMLSLLVCDSPVIFLDEPLTSLDIIVAADIKKIIRKMKENHIIIFSTHLLQLAQDLCDELVILNDKKLNTVDRDMLQDKNFEEKIIQLLKDGDNE